MRHFITKDGITKKQFNVLLSKCKKKFGDAAYDFCENSYDDFMSLGYFWIDTSDSFANYGVDNNDQYFEEASYNELIYAIDNYKK